MFIAGFMAWHDFSLVFCFSDNKNNVFWPYLKMQFEDEVTGTASEWLHHTPLQFLNILKQINKRLYD